MRLSKLCLGEIELQLFRQSHNSQVFKQIYPLPIFTLIKFAGQKLSKITGISIHQSPSAINKNTLIVIKKSFSSAPKQCTIFHQFMSEFTRYFFDQSLLFIGSNYGKVVNRFNRFLIIVQQHMNTPIQTTYTQIPAQRKLGTFSKAITQFLQQFSSALVAIYFDIAFGSVIEDKLIIICFFNSWQNIYLKNQQSLP